MRSDLQAVLLIADEALNKPCHGMSEPSSAGQPSTDCDERNRHLLWCRSFLMMAMVGEMRLGCKAFFGHFLILVSFSGTPLPDRPSELIQFSRLRAHGRRCFHAPAGDGRSIRWTVGSWKKWCQASRRHSQVRGEGGTHEPEHDISTAVRLLRHCSAEGVVRGRWTTRTR